VAADAAEGMGASLRAAVGPCRRLDGVFVFLGDMPRVPPEVAPDLARALTGVDAVAPILRGRRGHPVLFGGACFPALRAWTATRRAQVLAAWASDGAGRQPDDAGVLFDVDRPEDLIRSRTSGGCGGLPRGSSGSRR
jgi:molybdenum cofactor cytidylyltransferase